MYDPYGPLDPAWGQARQRPAGSPVPKGWAGGHAFSRDGFVWSSWARCYNTSVALTNGTTIEHQRRERPKLLFDGEGRPTHLFNGAFDANGSPVYDRGAHQDGAERACSGKSLSDALLQEEARSTSGLMPYLYHKTRKS